MSRIGKLSILLAMYYKGQRAQNSEFSWFQGPFFLILGGLGTNFHDFFVMLETGLRIDDFWDHPRS